MNCNAQNPKGGSGGRLLDKTRQCVIAYYLLFYQYNRLTAVFSMYRYRIIAFNKAQCIQVFMVVALEIIQFFSKADPAVGAAGNTNPYGLPFRDIEIECKPAGGRVGEDKRTYWWQDHLFTVYGPFIKQCF